MWVSDTSIRQPVLVTMMMLLALVMGLIAYSSLPVNMLPDATLPAVAVSVVLPGAGPEEIADQVAKPIEDGMGTLEGVKHITSYSYENLGVLVIEFGSEYQVDQVTQDVRDKLTQVRPTLPTDIQEPIIQKFDIATMPIMSIAVASNDPSLTPDQLRKQLEDEIIPRLQRVNGVASAELVGGLQREVHVDLNLAALQARGIAPQQVAQAIQAENITVPGGKITQGNADIAVRTPGKFKDIDDLSRVSVATRSGLVRLADIATVENGFADVTTLSRLDGEDAIRIDIYKQSGTNTVRVTDGIKAELKSSLSNNDQIAYKVVRDDSITVRTSVNSSIIELILGAISAALVVLLFFRDLRNTLVTVAGLPVILIATFAAMSFFGLTINMMTLLALSLSVGLVIDDAIVVRENIFRYMERGYDPKTAASKATAQVASSVLAMSLTIVSVFVPVALVTGIISGFFRPFGLTVASAMVISLFEAFTLAPMLSAHLFKQKAGVKPPENESELAEEAVVEHGRMDLFYQRILRWTLSHRRQTVIIGVMIVTLSLVSAAGLKMAFIPDMSSSNFTVGFRLNPGTSLGKTDSVARQVEDYLMKDPAIETVLTTVGVGSNTERAEFFVKLKEGYRTVEVQKRLRPALANVPNLAISVPSIGPSGTSISSRSIQMQLQTTGDLTELSQTADQIKQVIQTVPGLVDLDSDYQPGRPEMQIQVDRDRSTQLGISTAAVGSTIRMVMNGQTASTFTEQGSDYDIVVRLRPEDRGQLSDILALSIASTQGAQVPLRAVADLQPGSAPTQITRQDRLVQITIGGNNYERNMNDVIADIKTRTAQIQLPHGVTMQFAGMQEYQNESFQTLLGAMLLSFVFMYIVLASQFGSFLQPVVIMLAIPLSFVGAFLILRVFNIPLDILAMIGMIMLMGLVTKNSILMVDFTNRLRRHGLPRDEALLTAAPTRLRPILMTTLAIMLGSLPTAIGFGEGSDFRRPLALVIIGGLITSTLLTLFLVPTAYSLLDSVIKRAKSLLTRRSQRPAPKMKPASVPVRSDEV